MNIGTKTKTLEILNKFGTSPTKKFGQNFLIDVNILKKITDGANITKDTLVIEVGPGIGALTEHLASAAKKVICIEIDKLLIPILKETLHSFDNIELINEDILKIDLVSLLKENSDFKDIAVVANLPYYITTPIIMTFLENCPQVNRLILMMQKEVASRLGAKPNTKQYNSLSIAINYYTEVSTVTQVSKNVFFPRPNVDSTVIKLQRLSQPPVNVSDEDFYFKLVRKSFAFRRKTLINNLLASYEALTRDMLESIFTNLNISLTARPDNLTIFDYANLSNTLIDIIK